MPGYSFLFGGIGDRKGQCRKCDLASADTDLKLQGLQSWAYLHLMHWFSGRDAPGKTIVGGAGCGGTGLWRKSTESAGWGGTVPRQQAEAFICLFVVIYIFGFWLCCVACRILVPQPGIKPMHPAVEAQSEPLDHQEVLALGPLDKNSVSNVFPPRPGLA